MVFRIGKMLVMDCSLRVHKFIAAACSVLRKKQLVLKSTFLQKYLLKNICLFYSLAYTAVSCLVPYLPLFVKLGTWHLDGFLI